MLPQPVAPFLTAFGQSCALMRDSVGGTYDVHHFARIPAPATDLVGLVCVIWHDGTLKLDRLAAGMGFDEAAEVDCLKPR